MVSMVLTREPRVSAGRFMSIAAVPSLNCGADAVIKTVPVVSSTPCIQKDAAVSPFGTKTSTAGTPTLSPSDDTSRISESADSMWTKVPPWADALSRALTKLDRSPAPTPHDGVLNIEMPGCVTDTPSVPASVGTNPGIAAVTSVAPIDSPSKATPPVPMDPGVLDCNGAI